MTTVGIFSYAEIFAKKMILGTIFMILIFRRNICKKNDFVLWASKKRNFKKLNFYFFEFNRDGVIMPGGMVPELKKISKKNIKFLQHSWKFALKSITKC